MRSCQVSFFDMPAIVRQATDVRHALSSTILCDLAAMRHPVTLAHTMSFMSELALETGLRLGTKSFTRAERRLLGATLRKAGA